MNLVIRNYSRDKKSRTEECRLGILILFCHTQVSIESFSLINACNIVKVID